MRKYIFLFLLVFHLPLYGQDKSSEVEVLTTNYEKAVERSTRSLTNTYKEELKKLLKKYSEKGDIKEVEKITNILKQYEATSPQNDKIDIIIGEWKSAFGTTWIFNKDKTGQKINKDNKTSFVWDNQNDVYTILGRDSDQSSVKKWFMKVNGKELLYGLTDSDYSLRLTRF